VTDREDASAVMAHRGPTWRVGSLAPRSTRRRWQTPRSP